MGEPSDKVSSRAGSLKLVLTTNISTWPCTCLLSCCIILRACSWVHASSPIWVAKVLLINSRKFNEGSEGGHIVASTKLVSFSATSEPSLHTWMQVHTGSSSFVQKGVKLLVTAMQMDRMNCYVLSDSHQSFQAWLLWCSSLSGPHLDVYKDVCATANPGHCIRYIILESISQFESIVGILEVIGWVGDWLWKSLHKKSPLGPS